MKKSFALVLLSAAALRAVAETRAWTPGIDHQFWWNPKNWEGGEPPTEDDTAQIKNTPKAVAVDRAAQYNQLELAPDAGDAAALRIMPGGEMSNNMGNHYVGLRGRGSILQDGGVLSSSRDFSLGHEEGAQGEYILNDGVFDNTAWGWHTWIGNAGRGSVKVAGGSFKTHDAHLGTLASGFGRVEINGGEFIAQEGSMTVGAAGRGEFINNGGDVKIGRNLVIGESNPEASRFSQLGGSLKVTWDALVGVDGAGELLLGTDAAVRGLFVGVNPGGRGRVEIENAALQMDVGEPLCVGKAGHGGLVLKGAVVRGNGVNNHVIVREVEEGAGVLQGWGEIHGLMRPIVNNGRIVADGFGEDRELKFTGYNHRDFGHHYFSNSVVNTSANGWYAQNGGLLSPPAIWLENVGIPIDYIWGESMGVRQISMVNAMRLRVIDWEGGEGYLNAALFAPDRKDVPKLPEGKVIGLWRVDFPGVEKIMLAEVEIRFDHVAANGAVPGLWQYNPLEKTWAGLDMDILSGDRLKSAELAVFKDGGLTLGFVAVVATTEHGL